MRTTHTYAILELTPSAYDEIKSRLEEAGYQHAFHIQGDGRLVIDMSGIAVSRGDAAAAFPIVAGGVKAR